jgi:glutamyl-tRNA reductase
MELQLFGINHKTSDVSEREKFIINDLNQEYLNKHLKKKFGDKLESFFGLSTCNRTEIYLTGEKGIAKHILNESKLFLETEGIPDSSFYFLSKQDAMVHMSKVASGIDSQILGEQEILGQFKNAMQLASDSGILKGKLLAYSQKVLKIVKNVRTNTQIGLNPLSVSGLSLKLVKSIFEKPEEQNVLILGAGSLAKAVIENLNKKGINKIKAVNRSIKTMDISDDFKITSSKLDKLHKHLEDADIVIASATTDIPLIGKGAVENALRIRRNKPMLLIDLSVPRNIEEEIKNIEQVYLFSIDDIEKITQDNLGQREIEAEKALSMIVLESQKTILDLKEKNLKDKTKKQLEAFLNSLSKNELERFKSAEDLKQMIMNIAVIKLEENPNLTIPDIEKIKPHIIESMFKRYIDNA